MSSGDWPGRALSRLAHMPRSAGHVVDAPRTFFDARRRLPKNLTENIHQAAAALTTSAHLLLRLAQQIFQTTHTAAGRLPLRRSATLGTPENFTEQIPKPAALRRRLAALSRRLTELAENVCETAATLLRRSAARPASSCRAGRRDRPFRLAATLVPAVRHPSSSSQSGS